MAESHPLDDPADAEALARHAEALAAAIEEAVARSVAGVLAAQGLPAEGHAVEGEPVDELVAAAAASAQEEGVRRVRRLLATDVDAQAGTPLAILRSLVTHPTAVLRRLGARPVPRDDFRERSFPDDVYDLSPASFAEVDPALHEPGLVWGAAKAHVHLARRRREGKR